MLTRADHRHESICLAAGLHEKEAAIMAEALNEAFRRRALTLDEVCASKW